MENHDKRHVAIERFFSRRFLRLADAIITHTESLKREVISHFAIEATRVWVIPHGNYIGYYPNTISRAEARRELLIPERRFVFLLLGRIYPYKGVCELIQQFKRLPHKSSILGHCRTR